MIMGLYSSSSSGQVVLESIFDTGHIANIVGATYPRGMVSANINKYKLSINFRLLDR